MARGAVGVEVGADPGLEGLFFIVGIGQGAGVLVLVAGEDSQFLQGLELWSGAILVVVVSVELVGGDAEQEIVRAAVARHALGTTRDSPGLFFPIRLDLDVEALLSYKLRLGLLFVPQVGIACPFAVLTGHQASFNPVSSDRQRLDDDGSLAKLPAPVSSEGEGHITRQGEVALGGCPVHPAG